MIPLKSILYLFLLLASLFGSVVYHPLIGVLGYIFTYNINPLGHWWGTPFIDWGVRYSLFLALATGLGIVFHRSKLKFNRLFESQEILLLIFLVIIWLSIPLGFGFNQEESNVVKMTKVVFILLMASHVITNLKHYQLMIWTLLIAGLYLGFETYKAPDWMFSGGRFHGGIGGSDFSEGNYLGAHFAMLLPIMGVMFLKGGWKSKTICLLSGVFVINGIILCRSRGISMAVFVGIISAIIFSIPKYRLKLFFGLSIAIAGGVFLTDPGFWGRMKDIEETPSQIETSKIDSSIEGRILAWEVALKMASDYPHGIGEGNFKKHVGEYNPGIAGKDTHNTLLRSLAELGIHGAFVLLLLISNAFWILYKLKNNVLQLVSKNNYLWHIYGLKIALIIYLVAGMFITHTYIEEFYWLLMFPIFLKRAVENELNATKISKK